jgi:PKD repeat protein
MFSKDQANLMQQNFVDISFMAAVASPANVVATGINLPDVLCKADFDASQLEVCSGDSISFIDRSFHAPTGWIWSVSPGVENTDWAYTGGTNSTSQQPIIRFYTEGLYQITLTATDGVSSDTEVKDQYIRVLPAPVTIPFWEGFESIASLSSTPNWFVSNPGNNNGFEIEPSFGHSGAKCARLLNFGQVISNSDELISSPMDLSVLDPLAGDIVTLSFRYAYRKRAVTDDEWLKVFITKDCNQNWVQRKTLHGNALSSQVATTSWSPAQSDWVTVHVVNITAAYFVENFRFKFEFEGSGGNNFFLDDINLYAGSPSDNIVMGLANEGEIAELSLYPNPAEEEVNVRFSLAGDERTLVQITDLAGKVAGNYVINAKTGANLVSLNTSELAPGSYFVTIQTGDARSTLQFVVK